MINGKRDTAKMTWQKFQEWQRWDEFPERANDPPMTVDVMFFYEGNEYYITGYYEQYHFFDKDWKSQYANENFLKLLTTPIDLFHGKSFEQVIGELDFDV